MTTRAQRVKYTLVAIGAVPIALFLLAGLFVVGWIWGGWFMGSVDAVSAATGVPLTLLLVAIALSMWWWSRRR